MNTCSPHVRVGTTAWHGDEQAESPDTATAQIGPAWVEIDGRRYDCVAGPVVYRTGEDGDPSGIATVTLTLVVASFEVVPASAADTAEAL